MSEKPVNLLIEVLGMQDLRALCDVSDTAIYNWRHRGIPGAQKWAISRELRTRRNAGRISDQTFLEVVRALEENTEPAPA